MLSQLDEHAFVIKLYEDEGRRLRGHITHAYTHRRQPIHEPEDVLVFLGPYLASMDVQLSPKSRLLLWLSHLHVPGRHTVVAPPETE